MKRKKRRIKKRLSTKRTRRHEPRFGYVQEILLLLMVVCGVGMFFVPSPWPGYMMLGFWLCLILLLINSLYNKKLVTYLNKLDSQINHNTPEPGQEAYMLMNGLARKDHYKDLPPEVREKSILGKRD